MEQSLYSFQHFISFPCFIDGTGSPLATAYVGSFYIILLFLPYLGCYCLTLALVVLSWLLMWFLFASSWSFLACVMASMPLLHHRIRFFIYGGLYSYIQVHLRHCFLLIVQAVIARYSDFYWFMHGFHCSLSLTLTCMYGSKYICWKLIIRAGLIIIQHADIVSTKTCLLIY